MDWKLPPENQVLLDILANELFDAHREISLENIDIEKLLQESRNQTVTAQAFEGLSFYKNQIPPIIYGQWSSYAFQQVVHSTNVFFQHKELHNWLTDINVPYCILKGCASAHYYPKPYLRCMGDVDFLISTENVDKATDCLLEQGYISSEKEHEFHISFYKEQSVLELHLAVSTLPEGEAGDTIREWMEHIIDDAETVNDESYGTLKIPCWFHHGLIILIHAQRHLLQSGIGLRHFCDWAVYINRLDSTQRALLKERLQKVGLWRMAQILSQTAVLYLGMPNDDLFGDLEIDLCLGIMEDIMLSGNFGRKDFMHSMSSLVLPDVRESKNSMIRQAFLSLNSIVYSNWPKSKRLKLILPIGYVYFPLRYAFRSLIGKRDKVKIKDLLTVGSNRRKVYGQLHIFEI